MGVLMTERNERGQFVKGVSGNIYGRGKGNRGKKMSDAQLREYLGKKTQFYIEQIASLASDNIKEDPALSFKCYQALLKADFDMRIGALKEQVKGPKKEDKKEKEETHTTPILKLT